MKRAGTVAVAHSRGPGSFASAFLDALYTLEEQA
jgi:hydroxyethylthiazole kinase